MTRPYLLAAGLLCGAALLACGPQPPEPPPVTTTTTTTLPICYAPIPGPGGDYVPDTWAMPLYLDVALEVEQEIGPTCYPGREDIGLELLAAELRKRGLCASHDVDRVLVMRDEVRAEELHAISYATGCWASAARQYLGVLRWVGR